MGAPRYDLAQVRYQNPYASAPLIVPVLVVCNTSDEDLERNIRANSARDLKWLWAEEAPATERPAVIVGGGPSVADFTHEIRELERSGAAIFACNAASQWLRNECGVLPDYQVICDAKPETAALVDPYARGHLFASQVNPATMETVERPILWHLGGPDIEPFFPEERVKGGGYSLFGGGAAVGNSALCVAYALGHRVLHVFGLDSSHRDGASHAYDQPMNQFMPVCEVEWAGRKFFASVAMKAQAEKFQITGQALQQAGATLHVYGDGLLQQIWNTPTENLDERDKYRLMWNFDAYRTVAPGEWVVEEFLSVAQPPTDSVVIDFGCGTGRAMIAMQEKGLRPVGVDFADNCRDHEALGIDFLEWDLSRPCPLRAPFGYCTDVMEHIPPEQVDQVLANIFEAARSVFFQICTAPDHMGALIKQPLHLSVHPHAWWADKLSKFGAIRHEREDGVESIFYVVREEQ